MQLDATVHLQGRLTGRPETKEFDDSNSLRNIHCWVTDRMKFIGKQVANLLESVLDEHPEVQSELLDALGKQAQTSGKFEDVIDELRGRIRSLLRRNRWQDMAGSCDLNQVDTADYKTVIRAGLLHYWAQCVDDPGCKVARWLQVGAPAKIACDTKELEDGCPKVENDSEGSIGPD